MAAAGVRNQVAPANMSARALRTPRASDPHTGCPPTKRPLPPAAAISRAFVEPTSETAQSSLGRVERARDQLGQPGDGAADDGDLGIRDGRLERALDTGGGAPLESGRGGVRIRVERDHLVAALPGGQADRAADQAEADDGDSHQVTPGAGSSADFCDRISSARRKARSSDWRAFSRGSHRVW